MTDLSKRKTKMKTLVNAREQGWQLVVELHPNRSAELYIRQAGKRKGFWVPFCAIWTAGARLEAERVRKERAERRKAKR